MNIDYIPQKISNRTYKYLSVEQALKDKYVEQLCLGYDASVGEAINEVYPLYLLKTDAKTPIHQLPSTLVDTPNLWFVHIENWAAAELDANLFLPPQLKAIRIKSEVLESLPTSIAKAKGLEILIIESTKLRTLPKELGELKKLQHLALIDTELTELPENIGELKSLETIVIKGARLRQLPKAIGQLSKLKKIYLVDTLIEELPDSIGGLSKLSYLHVIGSKLKTLPKTIEGLKALEYLEIQHAPLEDLPPVFDQLKKLERIILNNCGLSQIPAAIFSSTSIHAIEVQHNRIVAVTPAIANMKRSFALFIQYNQLERFPAEVAASGLASLYLTGNPLQEVPDEIVAGDKLSYVIIDKPHYVAPETQELIEYIKNYKKSGFDAKYKLPFYHIWAKKEAPIKQLSFETLLLAVNYPLPRIYFNAIYALVHYSAYAYVNNPLKSGDELVILGKVALNKNEIKKQLKAQGVGYSTKITSQTTHILLGDKFKEKLLGFKEGEYIYLMEKQLVDYFNTINNPYLLDESPETQNFIDKIINLIESTQAVNIEIALQLIQGGGVPVELSNELFAIYKLADNAKSRSKAKKLLSKIASTELLAKMKERCEMRNHMHNGYDFRRQVSVFDDTEIDVAKIAMYYFLFNQREKGGAGYVFKHGSDELIHYFIKNHLIQNNEINLDRNNLIEGFPIVLCQYSQITKLAIKVEVGTYKFVSDQKGFPDELLNLTQLEELIIYTPGYVLEHIPKCLMQHPSLKKMIWYQRNSPTEKKLRELRPDLEVISQL